MDIECDVDEIVAIVMVPPVATLFCVGVLFGGIV